MYEFRFQYPIFEDLNKFKVSLVHEKASETSKKKKNVGCYTQWLKRSIYADVNVGVEISKYVYPNVYPC